MSTVYLNGAYLSLADACVSVTDRGFLFGDGVYEVIPAYGGRLLRFRHHLQRLQNSLDAIRLANPLDEATWREVCETLLRRNRKRAGPDNDQSIYLQITRGCAENRDHAFPEVVVPTIYVAANPITPVNPGDTTGVAVITLDDIRWQRCDIKAVTLLANVLVRQQAVERGAAEALLVRDGKVIEGSSSNVFLIRDGALHTPPKGPLMLPGITRDLVLELAAQHGIAHHQRDIGIAELRDAEEIWISSSTREIVPVVRLDDAPVGDGQPGPLWTRMMQHYQDYKAALRRGDAH